MSATIDSSNVNRNSQHGTPTFDAPDAQGDLESTLREYSGLYDDVSSTVGNIIGVFGGKKSKPASQPKPAGPATGWSSWADKLPLILGGLAAVALVVFLIKRK